jgi:hypothetical protein
MTENQLAQDYFALHKMRKILPDNLLQNQELVQKYI